MLEQRAIGLEVSIELRPILVDHLRDPADLASDSTSLLGPKLFWRFVCDVTWVLSDSRLCSFSITNNAIERTASVQLPRIVCQMAITKCVLYLLMGSVGDYMRKADTDHAQ